MCIRDSVCNVLRSLYVSVRYLENSSFWFAEYGPGYSVWFLDIFSCLVCGRLKNKNLKKSHAEGFPKSGHIFYLIGQLLP